MLTAIIDMHEGRDVAVVDMPGAYLNPIMDEFILLWIVDKQVDIMIKFNEDYKNFVEEVNGRRSLYLMLNKALYSYL